MDEIAERLTAAVGADYSIVRPLGAGGMSYVYLARDLRHGRDVAIKVMKPELTEGTGSERFLREIRLLARLQHPNILGLVDSGDAGGLFYYVMPYLAAGSLRARLDRERELPIEDALRLLREISGALVHAHAQGVVHRDIKPENVLFSAGHAQVSDFGIARIVNASAAGTALTTAGLTIGTPQYMAPEQAGGDPQVDHRADLYSLGVLAYETLAGIPPFAAGSAGQLLAMHLSEEPAPLARRRPSVPPELEELVMRCLRKRPADRWQSARDLLDALERVGTDARPPRGLRTAGTVTSHMPVTEGIARRLERSSFDPRMIGDSLEYLDNRVESDVLVMLLHAAWLEGTELEAHLRMLPYRCIAPTLYGFATRSRHRFPLTMSDHLTLLGELLHVVEQECSPSLLLLAGFSASGDLVLRLPGTILEGRRVPDGVFGIGPNQGIETCFLSRQLADLEGSDSRKVLAAMRAITDSASSMDDWLLLNGYIARIMARFRTDVSPLVALARDVVAPFLRDDTDGFAAMYRDATAHARRVRCVFEDSEVCNRLLRAALTAHMDRHTLGDRHRDGALLIEPTPSHFDLLQPERIAAHLDAMVAELRTAGP